MTITKTRLVRGFRQPWNISENRLLSSWGYYPPYADSHPIRLRSDSAQTFSAPDSLGQFFSPLCTRRHFTTPGRFGTRRMSSRKAACEACRKSKLACDHGRPACSRCASQGRAESCIYRASPFKRKQPHDNESPEQQQISS